MRAQRAFLNACQERSAERYIVADMETVKRHGVLVAAFRGQKAAKGQGKGAMGEIPAREQIVFEPCAVEVGKRPAVRIETFVALQKNAAAVACYIQERSGKTARAIH